MRELAQRLATESGSQNVLRCKEDGTYYSKQCIRDGTACYCIDQQGQMVEGSMTNDVANLDCDKGHDKDKGRYCYKQNI